MKVLSSYTVDEILFAELNKRETKKKEEAEKKKQQKHREKVKERNAILAVQKEMKENKENEERVLTARERQMLNTEWEKQSELEKLKERREYEKRRSTMLDIYETNERQKEDKENQNLDSKKRDKELIDRAVERERQVIEIEKQMKQKHRSEAQLVLRSIKDRSGEIAAYEKGLEEIIEKERLRQEREQDEAWERKERQKLQFMHDVFKSRQEILNRNKEDKEEAKNVKR